MYNGKQIKKIISKNNKNYNKKTIRKIDKKKIIERKKNKNKRKIKNFLKNLILY